MRKLKPMPSEHYILKVNRKIDLEELNKIKQGKVPNHQDDRWIIYFDEPWLYFHRNWTTSCIYKVHVSHEQSEYIIDKVLINGNSEEYKYDKATEEENFNRIFQYFLDSKV